MDYKVLGYQQQRELYYRVLVSPIGYLLRNSAIQNSKAHKIAPLVQFIEHNYCQPITIQDLATRSGMSTTTLHAIFKQTTSLSPIHPSRNFVCTMLTLFYNRATMPVSRLMIVVIQVLHNLVENSKGNMECHPVKYVFQNSTSKNKVFIIVLSNI